MVCGNLLSLTSVNVTTPAPILWVDAQVIVGNGQGNHVVLVRVFTSTTMRPFETSSVVFTVRGAVLRAASFGIRHRYRRGSSSSLSARDSPEQAPVAAEYAACSGATSQNSSRTTALIAGFTWNVASTDLAKSTSY